MADDDQDDSQKTEEPSQKRLEDATKKGQVPNSREVTSFLMLLAFALSIIWMVPSIMTDTTIELSKFISMPHNFRIDSQSLSLLSSNLLAKMLGWMFTPVIIIVLVIFLSSILQHGIIISTDPLMPKLERISLIKGLGRMFSTRTIVEFLKGLFKITLIAIITAITVYPYLTNLKQLVAMSIGGILALLLKIITSILVGICSFMAIIAVLDFLYQQFEHIKSLKMSKKDVKDEYKQTEGSPEIKAKLRELRNERANNRMMGKVPDADVVITNPTHYSIALQYEEGITNAPILVAKGQDLIALKIREIAKENDIPIVENPPLARALFASVEIDEEIPFEHYNAVAEVIKYIYKLKGKKAKTAA